MKRFFFLILSQAVLIAVVSCSSAPPDDLQPRNLLSFVQKGLHDSMAVKGREEERLAYRQQLEEQEIYLSFFKGQKFLVRDSLMDRGNSFIFSSPGGRVETAEDLYVTRRGKEVLFSFDGKKWYIQSNDNKKKRFNVLYDFNFETLLSADENILTVLYSWTARLDTRAETVSPVKNRKIVPLEKGLVFSHKDKKQINCSPDKNIILIPAGTIIEWEIEVEGNLVRMSNDGEGFQVEALRDLFLYRGKRKIGFSLDGKNWGVSLLAFEHKRENRWIALSDKKILMENYFLLNYNR